MESSLLEFTGEADARVDIARRVRDVLVAQMLEDGVTPDELEEDIVALTEVAAAVVDGLGLVFTAAGNGVVAGIGRQQVTEV